MSNRKWFFLSDLNSVPQRGRYQQMLCPLIMISLLTILHGLYYWIFQFSTISNLDLSDFKICLWTFEINLRLSREDPVKIHEHTCWTVTYLHCSKERIKLSQLTTGIQSLRCLKCLLLPLLVPLGHENTPDHWESKQLQYHINCYLLGLDTPPMACWAGELQRWNQPETHPCFKLIPPPVPVTQPRW